MGWKAAIGFVALGAAVVLGSEFVLGESLLKKIKGQSSSSDGYTLQFLDMPASVGYTQPIALRLTYYGQPVSKANVALTVTRDSGTDNQSIQTDVNGMALFTILTYNPQVIKVTATYTASATTSVTDVLSVDFRAMPTATKKG